MEDVNYVLIQFEGKINRWDPTGLKFNIQLTKEVDKETDKLDI